MKAELGTDWNALSNGTIRLKTDDGQDLVTIAVLAVNSNVIDVRNFNKNVRNLAEEIVETINRSPRLNLAYGPIPYNLVVGGRYRHFKGFEYQLESISLHTESQEVLYNYHSIPIGQIKVLFSRPWYMWDETVDAAGTKRFTYLGT